MAEDAAAPAVEREESIDYDALSFNDARYWAHFYEEDEEPAFYDVRACFSASEQARMS